MQRTLVANGLRISLVMVIHRVIPTGLIFKIKASNYHRKQIDNFLLFCSMMLFPNQIKSIGSNFTETSQPLCFYRHHFRDFQLIVILYVALKKLIYLLKFVYDWCSWSFEKIVRSFRAVVPEFKQTTWDQSKISMNVFTLKGGNFYRKLHFSVVSLQ